MSDAGIYTDSASSETGEPGLTPQQQASALAMKWRRRIRTSEKHFERVYFPQCKKIIARYRDERDNELTSKARRFNMLWSNVQTLGPAVYARQPKPEVGRRYHDQDPVSRVAASVLERAVEYEIDTGDFNAAMVQARDDYLLCGRGTHWYRYEPDIQVSEGPPDEITGAPTQSETLMGEKVCTDYVHWRDFFHSLSPTWQQVTWVARKVLMTKDAVTQRFGSQIAARVSYTHRQNTDTDKDNRNAQNNEDVDLAIIWEIWDKETRQAIWLSPDIEETPLDQKPDPLGLKGFFPCPKPLYATLTNDRLDPVPDYKLYQDQAHEIDTLTQRISLLQKALAVRGVYDGSNRNISGLLSERPENFLLPVDNWAAFAEKGGMKGQISFLPIEDIAGVLQQLQTQKNAYKQDIYEITGISDIIRGVSAASETATAQQIKGNYAGLRLGERRTTVGEFAREGLRITAQIICDHFQPETLREMSGFDQMTEVKLLQMQDAQSQQQGGAPGQAVETLWANVVKLLRSDQMRTFHIDVETDSMIEADQQEEQQNRVQFLTAAGGFINQALPVIQAAPSMAPLFGQMLLFAVRGFRVGRELESSFETAMDTLAGQPPQPPQPPDGKSPNQPPSQAENAMAQAALNDSNIKGQQLQLDAQTHQDDVSMAQVEAALKKYQTDAKFKIDYDKLLLEYGVHPAQKAGLVPMTPPQTAPQPNGSGTVQ